MGGVVIETSRLLTYNNHYLNIMTNTDTSFRPKQSSEQQVLRTPAGWYVGTLYFDSDLGGYFPNSRDTEYFPSYEEAKAYLLHIQLQEATCFCHVCDYPNDLEQMCCHQCGADLELSDLDGQDDDEAYFLSVERGDA